LLRCCSPGFPTTCSPVKPLKAMARENLANALLEGDTTQLNRALRKEIFSKEALRALQEPMLAILIAAGLYMALVRFRNVDRP
jgi:ATP-binding cassette subfamily C protein